MESKNIKYHKNIYWLKFSFLLISATHKEAHTVFVVGDNSIELGDSLKEIQNIHIGMNLLQIISQILFDNRWVWYSNDYVVGNWMNTLKNGKMLYF